MITEINAITPEYFKYRLEEETEQYKQEIERLNNIINKAINYIENETWFNRKELLEILKGVDKE